MPWHYKVENDGIIAKISDIPRNELIIVVCQNAYEGRVKSGLTQRHKEAKLF